MKISDDCIEIASVVLLFLSTLCSAWSAYQTVVWTSAGAVSLSEVDKAGSDLGVDSNFANQLIAVDVNVFMVYYVALLRGDKPVAEAAFRRFRPGLRKATEAWLATRPFDNPDSPTGPFAMKEYWEQPSGEKQKVQRDSANRMSRLAETRNANDHTDQYGLMTAIFAPLIFIGGVIPRFRLHKARIFIVFFSFVMLALALARLVTLPVTH